MLYRLKAENGKLLDEDIEIEGSDVVFNSRGGAKGNSCDFAGCTISHSFWLSARVRSRAASSSPSFSQAAFAALTGPHDFTAGNTSLANSLSPRSETS
jgi:hypothetical protein